LISQEKKNSDEAESGDQKNKLYLNADANHSARDRRKHSFGFLHTNYFFIPGLY